MRIIAVVLACWFLVTLFVTPKMFGKDWHFDIWTTNDVGEVSEALEAPFEIVLDIGAIIGEVDENQRGRFWNKVWNWILELNPFKQEPEFDQGFGGSGSREGGVFD